MPSKARACANRVLARVFEQRAYADRAFHACAEDLDERERAQAMRLSYGAVQRAGTLDGVIQQLSGRPVSALDPPVRAALRVGLYELLYSDARAEHAIVDDAVELVKRARSHGHGLTNAVLRRAVGQREQLLAGLRDDSTPQSAAIAHSHPEWLAEMWWRQLGERRARSLMAANNEPAESALRVNTLLADPAQIAAVLADLAPAAALERPGGGSLLGMQLPEAIVLRGPLDLRSSSPWRRGEVIAQSRAAMLVGRVLDPRPGERVLDLCAAPGGKSTHIAALMQGQGRIVAIERHPGRARELEETVARMHAGIVEVQVADAAVPFAGERFDRVLLDAPCSGLGTLQGHPDLRWRASPERIGELAALQCKILGAAAQAVRPGGTLVYSTCTISDAENEHQIERFLYSHSDFDVEPAVASGAIAAESAYAPSPFLSTLPDRDGTAGFFIAKLRRS